MCRMVCFMVLWVVGWLMFMFLLSCSRVFWIVILFL